jgi:hypothetical protein
MEPGLDQSTQGDQGVIGIESARFEVQSAAAPGGQGHHLQDALPIHRLAIEMDPDLGLKPLGQARKLMGRSQVKTQSVDELDLTPAGTHACSSRSWTTLWRRPGGTTAMALMRIATPATAPTIVRATCLRSWLGRHPHNVRTPWS